MSASLASHAPIGILDSGLGGLSTFREIHQLLPHESLIYIGDSAWCPYGVRPANEIINRVQTLTEWLLHQGCKLIVIACNSATIAAIESLRATYPIPFVGMEPGIKPAAALTRNGRIGILATEASLAGEKFLRLLHHHAHSLQVITRPCPRFVELVEQGLCTGSEARSAVEDALAPLLAEGVDTLVLGCTHYPFLREVIQEVAGPEVRLVDTGAAVAKRVHQLLHDAQLLAHRDSPAPLRFLSSGPTDLMQQLLPRLLPDLGPQQPEAFL